MPMTDTLDAATGREPVPFGVDLAEHVDAALAGQLCAAHRRLQRKGAVILGWYVASYVAMLAAPNAWFGVAACVSLGLSMAAVGFNIQHDASHNALFDTRGRKRLTRANRTAAFALNAIGGDADRWLGGHVRRHHSAPNVDGRDDDINLGAVARLAPSQPWRPWHRFQHLYLWVVYSFTAVLVVGGDITATIGEAIRGDERGNRPGWRTYVAMTVSKTLFFAVMLGVPLLFHTGWSVLIGAVVVTASVGLLLGVVFQLAHTVDGAEFRAADEPSATRWHQWQVQATVDFCHGNGPVARAVTWFAGGLNYQVEHHLFPQVPHTAYPTIAPVVAEVCEQHGVAYKVAPTLRSAIRGHYRHLRRLGVPAS